MDKKKKEENRGREEERRPRVDPNPKKTEHVFNLNNEFPRDPVSFQTPTAIFLSRKHRKSHIQGKP